MSDHPFYHNESPKSRLRTWMLGQMLYGAFWAAAVFVGCILFFTVFYGIGLLLPEESRQTPDPMPQSSLEQPLAAPGHDLA